jgi:hypothetical protein
VKKRIPDPTMTVAEGGMITAIAPYHDPTCQVCGHAIGAHFTSPDQCGVPKCPCARYVSSEPKFSFMIREPSVSRRWPSRR